MRDKGKRRGRNLQTGGELMLDARRMVRFKCSGKLREKVGGDGVIKFEKAKNKVMSEKYTDRVNYMQGIK